MDDEVFFAGLRTIKRHYPGLERLICLALAEPEFAARLLAEPRATLAEAREDLALSESECRLGSAITGASDLAAYAEALYAEVLNCSNRHP